MGLHGLSWNLFMKASRPSRLVHVMVLLLLLFLPVTTRGYSLLTHEQVIDILWKDEIKPLLLKVYPDATEDELVKAHAYAYGGCLVQDLGYYPLGNKLFSDLTHYIRSGDFIANLINESTNLNELAFGIGALCHYSADSAGHPYVNRAVGISFPKLRNKYGDEVTYAESPKSHIRVEFGFDVTQVSKNRYSSKQYHDFIGFEVSTPLLKRAFQKTYGIPLEDVLHPADLSIETFRHAVSLLMPELTEVALKLHPPGHVVEKDSAAQRLFLYHLSRSEYEKEWGKDYRKPAFTARVLAFLIKFIPKIGPLKSLDFKIPTHETEDLYFKSVNATVAAYRDAIHRVNRGNARFPDLDIDTGRKAVAGEYDLADATYVKFLDKLCRHGTQDIPPDLRQNILAYFAQQPKFKKSKDRRAWARALVELDCIRNVTPLPPEPPRPLAQSPRMAAIAREAKTVGN